MYNYNVLNFLSFVIQPCDFVYFIIFCIVNFSSEHVLYNIIGGKHCII